MSKIACTLTPSCTRRFLLNLRIKNGLKLEDIPKFCYRIQKGIIERHFRGKTVIYFPHDTYLYIVDFFDVFFHGDYRKLNKLIVFKQWKDAFKIFDHRIHVEKENFKYYLTEGKNYLIFFFEDRIHVLYLNKNYALCYANREVIYSLELLYGLIYFYCSLNFPDILLRLIPDERVELIAKIPNDILIKVSNNGLNEENLKYDQYFWGEFADDIEKLSFICEEVNLIQDENGDLQIKLNIIPTSISNDNNKRRVLIKFRDLRTIFDFVNRIYQDYYILHLEDYLVKKK
ncbi:MAG: hypothetical protein ACTSXH_04215 [Promethearchaeota archaeon]